MKILSICNHVSQSGQGRSLLIVPPLRTVLESFPAHGSRLTKPVSSTSQLRNRFMVVNQTIQFEGRFQAADYLPRMSVGID